MKYIKKTSIVLLLLVLLVTFAGFKTDLSLPEASYDFYVYDELGLVGPELKTHIVESNKKLYSETGAQLVVALIKNPDQVDIQVYANKLFEKWKIGSTRDNGILILIFPEAGQIWIETGYGVEGALPDSRLKRIIEDHTLPFFREGDYESGILSAYNQILMELEKEYDIDIDGVELENTPYQEEFSINPIYILIIVIFLIFIDSRFFGGALMRALARSSFRGGPPRGGGGTYGGGSRGSSGGGGRSGGGGAGGSW